MMSVCETGGHGGVVQLRRKKVTPTNPDSVDSLLQQEMQHDLETCYDNDQYSDVVGYPTLPRPKAILSLSRKGLPWSIQQASKLNTVPVRVRSKTENDIAAVAPGLKANRENHTILTKQSKRKSLNVISDLCSGQRCAEESITSLRVKESSQEEMSNHSKVQSRRAAGGEEVVDSQKKTKKSRKPSKSLTFSFGSNSDRKRRTLGFLGRGERKVSSPVTPDSPILVSRKIKTLPASSRNLSLTAGSELPGSARNGSAKSYHGSYQDIAATRSLSRSLTRSKHRPPPLPTLSNSTGTGVLGYPSAGVDSPLQADYSPALTSATSGMSSRQESSESLSYKSESSLPASLASNPPSRGHSPNVLRQSGSRHHSQQANTTKTTSRGRKLSDPVMSTPTDSPDTSPPQPGASTLKKRYTFCVRPSRINAEKGWKEMRQHVVRFLVETEQSYVESLKTILKVYYEPLQRPQASALVEPGLVRDIFYQIPEICSLHQRFLQQLTERVEHWDSERKIGDIFINTFSKCHLMDIYRKFIGNFMRAKASIELAKQAKSVFSKFLEQRSRDSEGKLSLDDLLIKPVQRIPRYVLFVKDLLKHTATTHPDHAPLQQALGELTMLAEKVNESERDRARVGHHKELLNAVDGLAQLLSPDSHFVSYNMVTEVKGQVQKRDRFLILFSDILICASSRRKSTSFKRSSMLNLNSVFSDGLKYNIKWSVPLTKTSVAQIQTPFFDRRRQNTMEKMLENLQKDEAILQEMLEMSASIHHAHQGLLITLRELQAEVREGVASKKAELDNLPPECARIDLVSYASAPPTQYTLLFPSQKIKNSWEKEFLAIKEAADDKAPPSSSIAPPTSPLPVQVCVCQELEFVNAAILQSVRPRMQVTCAAEGLAVDSTPSSCLWVGCSDGLGGQVSLLNLHPPHTPHLVANITVSDSPITCISAIPAPPITTPTASTHSNLLPDISVISTSSSSSSDHVTLSPTSSFDMRSMPSDKDDELLFLDSELELSTSSMATPIQALTNSLTVENFTRVRSNSAPPIPDPVLEEEVHRNRIPSPATGQQTLSAQSSATDSSESSRKLWSALTLRPPGLEEAGGVSMQSMWLGTEKGQVHVYRVGNNIRSRSNRITVEMGSAVHCIRHLQGAVYVGLADGSLAVLDACDPTSAPRHSVAVGGGAVRSCVSVLGELWVGCEGSIYQLDLHTHSLKLVCTLSEDQLIEDIHVAGTGVWVSVQRSSLLHLYHAPSGVLLSSIDCTRSVKQVLKSCGPVLKQHKSALLHITSLHSSPSQLMVGTSAGVVLAVQLPFIEPSLEPHPLLHPPVPTPLYHGHVDAVRFLLVVQKGEVPLVIAGGNGHEVFSAAGSSRDIPDASNALLLWATKD